jgi:hypothetical protein
MKEEESDSFVASKKKNQIYRSLSSGEFGRQLLTQVDKYRMKIKESNLREKDGVSTLIWLVFR